MDIKPNSKIKLDHLGQFYAATSNQNNPGTYSITVNLNQSIKPQVLQESVNNLMQRLPFINVKLRKGIMWYHHEVLNSYPKIKDIKKFNKLGEPFLENDHHLIRFMYSESSLTVEVFHTVCDGRSLSKIVVSLLAHYFELLGEKVNNSKLIDFHEKLKDEEIENANEKYFKRQKLKKEQDQDEVYIPNFKKSNVQFIVRKFDASKIKSKAKKQNLTISEYIIAHIGNEFKKYRNQEGSSKSITINIPIDCRSFFPSNSLRNFVTHKSVTVPENDEFYEIGKDLKKQFLEINKEFVSAKINEMERFMKIGNYMPLWMKTIIIKKIGEKESVGYTTGFSNLGLIQLPQQLKDKVDTMIFSLGPESNMPYQFSSMTVGNTLTITATVIAENKKIVNSIMNVIEEDINN